MDEELRKPEGEEVQVDGLPIWEDPDLDLSRGLREYYKIMGESPEPST